MFFFFFSSRRRHTRCYRDWSSDVCSSDLVLAGERKLGIGVHLQVGDRTLRVESFFMRAPEEQHGRRFSDLLTRQASSYVLRFTLDENGDLFVVGQVPLLAVTAEEVDRIVGSILELCDTAYLPSVEIGFASSLAAERAWRAKVAAQGQQQS